VVLEIQNVTQAVNRLDDDERSMFNVGRQGEINIISESGLYTLMLRCRDAVKPGSVPHRVRKWVTSEVLPAIRKTGHYEHSAPIPPAPTEVDDLKTRLAAQETALHALAQDLDTARRGHIDAQRGHIDALTQLSQVQAAQLTEMVAREKHQAHNTILTLTAAGTSPETIRLVTGRSIDHIRTVISQDFQDKRDDDGHDDDGSSHDDDGSGDASHVTKTLTVGTFPIRYHDGLLSLNDLHRASGGDKKHKPERFLGLGSTKKFIKEIFYNLKVMLPELFSDQEWNDSIIQTYLLLDFSASGHGDTYVCSDLATTYATWISSKFGLKVKAHIQAYCDEWQAAMRGDVEDWKLVRHEPITDDTVMSKEWHEWQERQRDTEAPKPVQQLIVQPKRDDNELIGNVGKRSGSPGYGEELKNEVLSFVKQDGRITEAAKRYKVSYQTIQKWLKATTWFIPGASKVDVEVLRQMMEANPNLTSTKLAQVFHVCIDTIHSHLKNLGFRYIRPANVWQSEASVDTVAAEILEDVFDGELLPFKTNPDGSVPRSVYQVWFAGVAPELRQAAIQAFEENSEVIVPEGGSAVETYRRDVH
jgi:prophage antirepressor-like protein